MFRPTQAEQTAITITTICRIDIMAGRPTYDANQQISHQLSVAMATKSQHPQPLYEPTYRSN